MEYDDTNPEHRFILAVLFGELANERTEQLLASDLHAIFEWMVTNVIASTDGESVRQTP